MGESIDPNARSQSSLDILAFTDPECTWCWDSEPVLRKLETWYDDAERIRHLRRMLCVLSVGGRRHPAFQASSIQAPPFPVPRQELGEVEGAVATGQRALSAADRKPVRLRQFRGSGH